MVYFGKAKLGKELYANAQDYEETEIAKTTNEIESYTKMDGYVAATRGLEGRAVLLAESPTTSSTSLNFSETIDLPTNEKISDYSFFLLVALTDDKTCVRSTVYFIKDLFVDVVKIHYQSYAEGTLSYNSDTSVQFGCAVTSGSPKKDYCLRLYGIK